MTDTPRPARPGASVHAWITLALWPLLTWGLVVTLPLGRLGRPELGDYVVSAVLGGLLAFLWPLSLPLAVVGGLVYLCLG